MFSAKPLIVRLRGLFRRDAVAGEIHDELEFHLRMRIEEYERAGLSPHDARRRARQRVGNVSIHQDRGYDVRGGGVMETIVQDVRYAIRLLRKRPGFSAIAILTLALGIGASTALFTVIDAALLHPLPYPHPDRLAEALVVNAPDPRGRVSKYGPSLDDVRAWRSVPSIGASAIFRDSSPPSVVDAGGGPERVIVDVMSEGFLEVCGLAPVVGRGLRESDVAPGAPPTVLLGYRYWHSHFGGNPNVIGATIRFIGADSWAGPPGPATVIGVLPETFFPKSAMWRAATLDNFRKADKRGTGQSVVVRLREGASMADAARDVAATSNRISAADAQVAGVQLDSWLKETSSGYASTINMLATAVALVLAIGCVNVAGLLFASGSARRAEFAIRASIGAGRVRLVRQMLTESFVLALAGGALGVLVAWLFLDSLVAIVPMSLPSSSAVSINGLALFFALSLSVVTTMCFGMAPAFMSSRVSLTGASGSGARLASAFSRRSGQALIAIEVALAVVMLAASGLLVKSLLAVTRVDLGLDPSAFLAMDVAPVSNDPAVITTYYRDVRERLLAVPGVVAVGAADSFAVGGRSFRAGFFELDRPDNRDQTATRRDVTPGYVEAVGQRLVQGRIPVESELSDNVLILINQTAAATWFPNGGAVGQSVKMFAGQTGTIVGVVGDVRQGGPLNRQDAEALLFSKRLVTSGLWVIVRPAPGVRVPVDALRRAVTEVGPPIFLDEIRSGADWISDRIASPRHRAALFGLLGGLGLVLTLVGIFGVTAYAVARRTQEIGLRMAFGARPSQVVGTMVGSAAWAVVIGTGIGLVAAFFATRAIAKFLFETPPTDVGTFAGVAVLLILASVTAAWIPARRAARIDPVTALREGA